MIKIDEGIGSAADVAPAAGSAPWYSEFRRGFVHAFDEDTMRRLERRVRRIPHGEERFMRAILSQVEFPVSATFALADAIKQAERSFRGEVVHLGPLGFTDVRERLSQAIGAWSTIALIQDGRDLDETECR